MAQTDTQSRKWQITINNPAEKGYTHDFIKTTLSDMKSLIYWCMSDEIGENGTYHTHIFLQSRGGTRFSTLKKRFEGAHFEMAKGTSQQNMEYVSKTGKWKNNKKSETSVPDTFEEFGEMPVERQGRRNDLDDLYSMIKDGYSDYQILEVMPESLTQLDRIDRVRQVLRYEEFKDRYREISVHYIYGTSGVGKTRSVMENYGYSNVYRVTDYIHPFDGYKGQDIVVFEEFRSGFSFTDMLNYLDGYPLELPCRYANKYACYTKVYIVTNIPISQQYTGVQTDSPDSWMAFIRRIKTVTQILPTGSHTQKIEFTPDGFYRMLDCEVSPFD
ncbi:MAG: replication protein [Lachnospiraceae bacterium]|nr:replication protein [Lachnospiraceae bacterium]